MKVSEVIGDDARVFTKSDAGRKPRISIITPTYRRNAEGLLAACLQSALDQTFTDFEHIIVDDGSSDGTEETVLRLAEQDNRIVYVRHDRNSGLRPCGPTKALCVPAARQSRSCLTTMCTSATSLKAHGHSWRAAAPTSFTDL